MKKIVICLKCNDVFPEAVCYQAKKQVVNNELLTGLPKQHLVEGYVCAKCNKKMGYKTNSKKLDKQMGQE
mgnify:FL=1